MNQVSKIKCQALDTLSSNNACAAIIRQTFIHFNLFWGASEYFIDFSVTIGSFFNLKIWFSQTNTKKYFLNISVLRKSKSILEITILT